MDHSAYADSAQARQLDRDMLERFKGPSDFVRGSGLDDQGRDIFTETCKRMEAQRLAGRGARIRAAMAQMELICPPPGGAA